MEIYVSTDIEADGPLPGPNSMLSFGSAAFTADGRLVPTSEANLHTLPGARWGTRTRWRVGRPSRRRGPSDATTPATPPRR